MVVTPSSSVIGLSGRSKRTRLRCKTRPLCDVVIQRGYTTSTPIERAVPFTEFMAASTVKQFKSGILILAISSTCFSVILPTRFLFGTDDPVARFTGRLIRSGTGGVFVMKVKDRSEKIVMTTGMINPS